MNIITTINMNNQAIFTILDLSYYKSTRLNRTNKNHIKFFVIPMK